MQRIQDLTGIVSFYSCSCLGVLTLLLAPNPAARRAGTLQNEAVETLAPRFAGVPLNVPPLRQRFFNRFRRLTTEARG